MPPYLIELLSSSICSRSRCASSWRAARSCCSLQMYSAVFCRVVALLTCRVAEVGWRRELLGQVGHKGPCAPLLSLSTQLQALGTTPCPGLCHHRVTSRVPACPAPAHAALCAHLNAGLGTQCAHQAVQCVKAQLDVETSLLLSRDVCDAPALHLQAAEMALGLSLHWRQAGPKYASRVGVNVGSAGRGFTWRSCPCKRQHSLPLYLAGVRPAPTGWGVVQGNGGTGW